MTIHDPQDHFLDEPKLLPNVTRFWLIRHGVVEKIARKTMYGTLDVPLCDNAKLLHKAAYRSLAQRLPSTDLWFSSPLKRAYDTALTIQKEGGFLYPIKEEKGFLEQSLGMWNGTPHKEFNKKRKIKPHAFWSISAYEEPPEGETMQSVKQRVGDVMEQMAENYAKRDMIIVSHGGAIRMALAHALAIEAENALHFTIQNLSYSILEKIGRNWRVISVNVLPDF